MKLNNKLHSEFLDLLIKFDFFLLESKNPLMQTRYSNKNIKLKVYNFKKNYSILTPAELFKSLKQFVRLLQFFKKQKDFCMTISINNDYFFDFFKMLMQKNNINKKKIFLEKSLILKSKTEKNIFLSFNKKNSVDFYKKIFQSFNYLIVEFVSFLQKNDFGAYKVFADFNDFKKYVFLFLLIKKIYFKNSKTKTI